MIVQTQEPALLSLPSLGTDGGQEQALQETGAFRNILTQLQTALTPPPPAEGQEQRSATPPAQEKREQQALESILHTIQEILPTMAMPSPLPPLPVAGVQEAIPEAPVPALSQPQQIRSAVPQALLSRPLNSILTPAAEHTLPVAPLPEAVQMSSAPFEGVFSAIEPQSAPVTAGTATPTATIPSTSFTPSHVIPSAPAPRHAAALPERLASTPFPAAGEPVPHGPLPGMIHAAKHQAISRFPAAAVPGNKTLMVEPAAAAPGSETPMVGLAGLGVRPAVMRGAAPTAPVYANSVTEDVTPLTLRMPLTSYAFEGLQIESTETAPFPAAASTMHTVTTTATVTDPVTADMPYAVADATGSPGGQVRVDTVSHLTLLQDSNASEFRRVALPHLIVAQNRPEMAPPLPTTSAPFPGLRVTLPTTSVGENTVAARVASLVQTVMAGDAVAVESSGESGRLIATPGMAESGPTPSEVEPERPWSFSVRSIAGSIDSRGAPEGVDTMPPSAPPVQEPSSIPQERLRVPPVRADNLPVDNGVEQEVAQVAQTSAAPDPRRPAPRVRLDMPTAMRPEQATGDAPQTPTGTSEELLSRPALQAVAKPMAANAAETLSAPQVPPAETQRSLAPAPLAAGRTEGTLTGGTAGVFPAPEDRQTLTSREIPHSYATEGQAQPQKADASLSTGEQGRTAMGHEQPEAPKAQSSHTEQTALPEGDFGGLVEAHVNERAVQPTRVDSGPVITPEKQEVQDVPRALPLAPENAGRLLGRPLSHGTILLQLHPPELGYMQVQVQLHNHQLSATFWADSPEVRALIQTHLPTLQQNLYSQGFSQHQVSTTLAGGGFAGQAGQFAQQHTASQSFTQHREPGTPLGRSSHVDTERGAYRSATRNSLVDVVI